MQYAQEPHAPSTKPARPPCQSVKRLPALLETSLIHALAWSAPTDFARHARSTLPLTPPSRLRPAHQDSGAPQIRESVTMVHAQLLLLPLPARSHRLAVPISCVRLRLARPAPIADQCFAISPPTPPPEPASPALPAPSATVTTLTAAQTVPAPHRWLALQLTRPPCAQRPLIASCSPMP